MARSQNSRSLGRRAVSLVWLPVSLAVAGAAVAVVVLPMLGGANADDADRPITHEVTRAMFRHQVTEPGELESSNNVEVRCEVKARNTTGTMILQIVPEGTIVKEGDFLIEFDSSALEVELTQQQIVSNSSQALAIQSRNVYETAVIAQEEYREGTFKQEQQTIQSEVFVAEENLRRAEEYLQYSRRLAARGYVTALQVEADRFAVEKARKELETAKTKLRVLEEYTSVKMIKQLEADIQTAKAKMEADDNTYKLDLEKLADIEEQIKNCRVMAPAAGKVIYANETDGRGNNEIVIEEGTVVRERQTVIRLPDLQKMQVKAKIDETRIGYIRVGQRASIRLDSDPSAELRGVVTKVDEYPIPRGWFNSSVKQYATYVAIDNATASMRPGMQAQVKIEVGAIPNAIALPVQAIVERGQNRFCVVAKGAELELRRIPKGPTNHKFVVIPEEDLEEGEQTVREGELVVLNPEKYAAEVGLPEPAQLVPERQDESAEGETTPPPEERRPAGAEGEGGAPGGANASPPSPGTMFTQLDTDGDGKLVESDLPEPMRKFYSQIDTNSDGSADRAEFMAAMAKARAAQNAAGGAGAPPGGGAP